MQRQPAITLIDPDGRRRTRLVDWLARAGHLVLDGAPGTPFEAPDEHAPHCFLIAEQALPALDPDAVRPGAVERQDRRQALSQATVIVLLEQLAPVQLLEGLRLGLADALGMPVSERELLEAVERALRLDGELRGPLRARRIAKDRLGSLSRRERQVLHGIVEGHSNRRIAEDLGVSVKTIESHRANLMRKSGCRAQACLVRLAVLAGEGSGALVPPLEATVAV
jgi:FixJ family two-component response regulator